MNPIHLIACALGVGIGCTFLVRSFAWKFNIVNKPNKIVPQHIKPIAYLGGAGIYLGILITCIGLTFFFNQEFPIAYLTLGGLYLILGVVDDLLEIKPLIKFIAQFSLAATTVIFGLKYSFTGLQYLDEALSILWILVLLNAFNLTDVCDGLLGGLSIIMLLLYFAVGYSSLPLPLIVAGAVFGFLVFNAPPATIFMGDAGSHFLGFTLAFFTLKTEATSFAQFIPLALLCGVTLFELLFLIIVRKRKGLKWWLGSPDHFSLRLQKHGKSKWQTNLIAWTLGLLSGIPLIVSSLKNSLKGNVKWTVATIVFVLGLFILFGFYLLHLEKKENVQ